MELDKIKEKRKELTEKFDELQEVRLNTEKNLKIIQDDLLTQKITNPNRFFQKKKWLSTI